MLLYRVYRLFVATSSLRRSFCKAQRRWRGRDVGEHVSPPRKRDQNTKSIFSRFVF